jgi:hypothetical protein
MGITTDPSFAQVIQSGRTTAFVGRHSVELSGTLKLCSIYNTVRLPETFLIKCLADCKQQGVICAQDRLKRSNKNPCLYLNPPQLIALTPILSQRKIGSNKLQVVAIAGILKERSSTKTMNEYNLKNG